MNATSSKPADDVLTPGEAAAIAACDGVFFGRYFFPRTARLPPAKFDPPLWDILDNPAARYCAFMIFRDGAKTTRLRLFTAKRVAYALSRTIIYVGKSQDHAVRSIRWLKKQIEFNRLFADTFGLRKGSKWTDEEIEIVNTLADGGVGCTITIVAFGVTGSIRGVNIDDYRPDLIIGDDLCDSENSKTPEQREKIKDLWFSDLYYSLAKATECPDAKMVLLGTMLDPLDVTSTCVADKDWRGLIVPVLDSQGESQWPERFPLATILHDRDQALRLNKLSLWTREMMCQWVSAEEKPIRETWIKRFERVPDGVHYYMSTDTALSKDKGDFTEMGVWAVDWTGNLYVCDWYRGRVGSHVWIEEECRLINKWRPLVVFGESGAIQKATEPFLLKRMDELRAYARLEWLPSIADKLTRGQGFIALCSAGKVWFPEANEMRPWVGEVLAELFNFPSRGVPDDAWDVCTLLARGLELVRLPRPRRPRSPDSNVVYLQDFASQAQAWMR